MSILELIQEQRNELGKVENELKQSVESISQEILLSDPIFVEYFGEETEESDNTGLKSLSLAQLNAKFDLKQSDVNELHALKRYYTSCLNIDSIVNKEYPNLLDYQQAFALFNDHELLPSNNYIIYKTIDKKVESLRLQFIQNLNDFLKKIIPDEYTIIDEATLQDLNTILKKNDLKLSYYNELKSKWDKILDKLDTYDLILSVDPVKLSLIKPPTTTVSFLTSMVNFINFINIINLDWLKHFFNSKISHWLNAKISSNINEVISDPLAIEKLNELIQTSAGWNILSNFVDNSSIELNLNHLYSKYTLDLKIDEIRNIFKGFDPSSDENNNDTHIDVDDWDDAWDDAASNDKIQTNDDQKNDNDDDSDGWGEWDENNSNEPPSENPQVHNQPVQNPQVFSDSKLKQVQVKTSSLPRKLQEVLPSAEIHSYFVDTIFALSSVTYPDLSSSFLLYNDLHYLSDITKNPVFSQYADKQWTLVKTNWVSELKSLVSNLNLTKEGEDDINFSQISSIHHLFDGLLVLNDTNSQKFQETIIELIEFVNNIFITSVIQLDEITEFQCGRISSIIESLRNITVPIIIQIKRTQDSVSSINKLHCLDYLVNHRLKDIMEKFYQGDLFSFETNELIKMIENIFIESELRHQSIQEIIQIREE